MVTADFPVGRAQATVSPISTRTHSLSEDLDIASAFGTLGHATRLGILRLLIQHEPHGVEAGKLASLVGGPRSTVSQHLAGLAKVGLVLGVRTQEEVRYRAKLGGLYGLLEVLLQDCCVTSDCACLPDDSDLPIAAGLEAH